MPLTEWLHYYDGFGRQVKTLFPDKVQQQSQVFWADGHEHQPQHALYYNWSQSSGMPPVLVFFDVLGRELRQVSIDFEGEAVYTDTHYTPQGNIDRVSLPYRSGTQAVFSYYQYDELQRVKMVTLPDNTTAKTEYYPNSVKSINALEQTTQKYFNAAGWLVRSEDNAGKSVEYMYFSDGKLKSAQIVDQAATTIELTYNARGQRHSLSDPNYGLTLTHYDAYDRLTEQISPKKETTTFTYDGLGRMTTRNGPEGLTSWEYDITPGRMGSLKSVGNETHQTTYTYDNLLRVTQVVDRIVDDEYTTSYTYDVYGRAKTTEYPTGYSLISFYNEHGYLSHFREGGSNNKVWEALEINALGQINRFATGNGLQTTNTYYPGNARLHTVQTKAGETTPIQDMEYGWDALGNLNYRKKWIDRDNSIYLNESFGYDVLNRLETIHLNEMETGFHRYDEAGLGNMMEKKADNNSVFANGAYDGSRPHALTSAHVNDNLRAYTSDDQAIGWTSFDQPEYIEQGTKRLEFTYGHHRQRIRQHLRQGGSETTKTFAGNCEFVSIDGQQYAYTYLSGPTGLFGIHVKNPDGTSGLFYIHTDHLGSLHTITDENGNLLQVLSFDAWGNRRNPATWSMFNESPETALFDRGFTGHEHLDGFQLINMNGRLYDPVISRMLSPDNFVQSPDFSQSFNRYSYAWNNPLVFTDPSGEIILLAAVYFTFFTDVGYEAQKYVSPVAVKFSLGNGSEGFHAGIETSIGIPKTMPFSYRFHWGSTYYSGAYDGGVSGNVNTNGKEVTYFGVFSLSSTQYHSNGSDGTSTSQTVGRVMIGLPGINLKYQNDWHPEWMNKLAIGFDLNDGGDRYRSAALQLNYGLFQVGFNLFTGDPGLNPDDRPEEAGKGIHEGKLVYSGGNANKYRSGIAYFGFGPIRIGRNSEGIRHQIQNRFAHDYLQKGRAAHFQVLDRSPKTYWYFGSGYGSGLW